MNKHLCNAGLGLVFSLSLIGCQPSENTTKNGSGLHANSHTDANKHMNETTFEELVARFEDPERDQWQQRELVIRRLGDLSGKTVADIGAGTGYFDFSIAKVAHKVIAIDIDQRFLDYIDAKKDRIDSLENLNLETRLTVADDPSLTPGEADLVILVNTYHHIGQRPEYFKKVKSGLKPVGIVTIIDFKMEDSPVGPPKEMRLPPETIVQELRLAGFSQFEVDQESLPYQFMIFAR